jgi:hypothetical protein
MGVTLLPVSSVFKSFNEYSQRLDVAENTYQGETIYSAELEIRDLKQYVQIVRAAYPWQFYHEFDHKMKDLRPIREEGYSGNLPPKMLQQLECVPPGTYQIAFYLNGSRASNVAEFTIDPKVDYQKLPTMRFGAIEPNPFAKYTIPVLLVVGPTPQDKNLTNYTIYAAPITVDGIERKRDGIVWTGPIGPLQSGVFWCMIPDFNSSFSNSLKPPVDISQPHTYALKIPPYEARPLTVDPASQPLKTAWDQATPKLIKFAIPPPALIGKITKNGHPLAKQAISIRADNGKITLSETADEQGNYSFYYNTPIKTYEISIWQTSPTGHSCYEEKNFTLQQGKTLIHNIDLTEHHQFSGKTLNHTGNPVSNINIIAYWISPDEKIRYQSEVKSDVNGNYTMTGLFEKISTAYISTHGWKALSINDFRADKTAIDFRLFKEDEEDDFCK